MTKSNTAFLYKIVNSINDKVYIGVSKHPTARFKTHLSSRSNCTKLKRAISKYGKDKFSMVILCEGSPEYIASIEGDAIAVFDSLSNGYNTLPAHHSQQLTFPQEVKDKQSASLKKYYENNQSANLGRPVKHRSDDSPVYILGFWFPNKRTAKKVLKKSNKTYYRLLGKEQHECSHKVRKDTMQQMACYVAGFWFPNVPIASEALGISCGAIRARIKREDVEQLGRKALADYTTNNFFNGKCGGDHPRARAVVIEGIEYPSISVAAELSGYTKKQIGDRLKNNHPDFKYK